MFKMMKSSHIGLHHPEFFLHWADFELKVDRRDKSLAVLSSANDTPIMRGNNQIKEAKEFIEIESGKYLKLEPLFTLNLLKKQQPITSLNTPTATSNTYLDSLDEKLSKIRNNRMTSTTLITANKRIKEDYEDLDLLKDDGDNNYLSSSHDKENINNNNNNNNNDNTGQSGNSNMSLTLTDVQKCTNIPFNDTETNYINNMKNVTGNTGGDNNNTDNIGTNASVNILPSSKVNTTTTVPNTSTVLKSRQVRINGKIYRVLQLIGRGGSSKVFRVIDSEGQIFALKKVNLKNLDEITLQSYTNEISVLKSFANHPHIIQLIDSEMNKEQACLYILMEYGEIDLGKMLKNRVESGQIGEKADENFIRFSFQQVSQPFTEYKYKFFILFYFLR